MAEETTAQKLASMFSALQRSPEKLAADKAYWAKNMPSLVKYFGAPSMSSDDAFAFMGATGSVGRGMKSALAMDEASRLSRANEMGYSVDAYKGMGAYSGGPTINSRGAVVRDEPWETITEIKSPGNHLGGNYAGFFTDTPSVTPRFTAWMDERAATFPVKLKFSNPLVIEANGRHAADFQFPSLARERGTFDDYNSLKSALTPDSPHDGVIIKGTKDEGTVYIPKESKQVRSRFAKFDPANKDSGDLLASKLSPMFVGGGALALGSGGKKE